MGFFSPVYTISKSLRPAVHWWSKTFCRWSALWWLECKPFFTMVFNLKTKFCRIRFLRLGLISFACVIPTPYPHAYHDLSGLVQHLPFVSGYTTKLLPAAMCWGAVFIMWETEIYFIYRCATEDLIKLFSIDWQTNLESLWHGIKDQTDSIMWQIQYKVHL